MSSHDPDGVVSLRSDGTIDQILRRAVTSIEARGLDIHAVIDHSGDAAEVGVTIPETKLVIFGGAMDVTTLILAHPDIAIELPLKLLIREIEGASVLISYHTPGDLAHRYALTERETDALRVVDTIARQTRTP